MSYNLQIMAKVYSYSDIQNNKIPLEEDFIKAKELLFERLSEIQNLYGAKVFGSVARGSSGPRSDFDVLILTEDLSSWFYISEIIEDIYQLTNVQIEPQLLTRKMAESGFHSLDAPFLLNIVRTSDEGNILKRDPTAIFRVRELNSAEQYLVNKFRRFTEALRINEQEDKLKVIQRALEAPVNVGRRVLEEMLRLGIKNFDLEDDSKQNVKKIFLEVFKGSELSLIFQSLIILDSEYEKVFRNAQERNMSRAEYDRVIEYLFGSTLPLAINWTYILSEKYIEWHELKAELTENNEQRTNSK